MAKHEAVNRKELAQKIAKNAGKWITDASFPSYKHALEFIENTKDVNKVQNEMLVMIKAHPRLVGQESRFVHCKEQQTVFDNKPNSAKQFIKEYESLKSLLGSNLLIYDLARALIK